MVVMFIAFLGIFLITLCTSLSNVVEEDKARDLIAFFVSIIGIFLWVWVFS